MTAITPILTTAGIQAVFNASNTGLQAEITHIALGDSGYTPTDSATDLVNEKQRVAVSGGEAIGTNQIHLTASASGTDEYWIREVGFFLSDGSLLALYSDPNNAIAYKSADLDILLSFDLLLSALPASSVTINGTGGLSFPAATADKQGIVRFATDAEASAGSGVSAAVLPSQLRALVPAGIIAPYAAETPPSGWLICNGSWVGRAAYADLFSVISTTFGIGDGSTSFAIPDLRGEFLRGLDRGRGVDAGRVLGSYQAGTKTVGEEGYTTSINNHGIYDVATIHGDPVYETEVLTLTYSIHAAGLYTTPDNKFWRTVRPRNIALNFIIKY